MDAPDEQRQAAEALATIRTHQERTRRAARVPWWVYLAMFVLGAGGMATNDFADRSSAKVLPGVIVVVLVVVLGITFAGRSAPLNRVRGMQARQQFVPQIYGPVLVVAGVGGWLLSQYGAALIHEVAGAVGLGNYPNTVAGVLYGAAFTALFALNQLLLALYQRRTNP